MAEMIIVERVRRNPVRERRIDGTVIVRVASKDRGPQTLPDAVFSFRLGDPQYTYWECLWQQSITKTAQAS